ncbi:MAG: GldG family protein, partial [Candidatus Omnitrophica bacterium]|nr:GldG family protein [Candidatus Omnitrophota bacterium]
NLRNPSQKPSKLYQWKKYGMIIVVIIISAFLWAGTNFSAYTFNQRWDLTSAKQHTLTGNTIELIKGLTQGVQLTAFYVGMPPKYLEDLLKEYERHSEGRIKTEIIDPIVQIGYAAKFGNVISGKEKKVIVQSGVERMDINFTKIPLSEEQLTNAILRVTREARNIYFLTGHKEYSIHDKGDNGLSTLSKLLSANNISSKELMLGIEEEIPEDCDVLIIAGPHDSFTEKEEITIEKYLEQGGDALFLIEHIVVTSPDKPLTEEEKNMNPSLNSILNNWGINIGNDIVVDLSSHTSGDAGSPATRNYMPHKAITENLDYTFYVRPRSISVLENRRQSIKTAPIVFTASKEKSWA